MQSWLRLPLILHAIAFGLPASLAQADVEDFPPELDDLRMNEVQLIGSHNSYHIQPDATLDTVMVLVLDGAPEAVQGLCPGETVANNCVQRLRYTHPSLDVQLGEMGIRQFELDVFADPPVNGMPVHRYQYPFGWRFFIPGYPELPDMPFDPGLAEDGFKVLHVQDIDFRSTCYTLVACLTTIRDWSLANPRHIPILVLIEVKDDLLPEVVVESPPIGVVPWAVPFPFGTRMFRLLEAEIRSVFDEDHLLTPDDVRGRVTAVNSVAIGASNELGEFRAGTMAAFIGAVPAVQMASTMDMKIIQLPKATRLFLFLFGSPSSSSCCDGALTKC